MKTIITGAEFIELALNESFSGKFVGVVLREKDSADGQQKAGTVMGYNFEDANNDTHIVGNSHQIEKGLTADGEGVGSFYKITFLGKGETAAKKPFNKYKVEAYDDEAEFQKANLIK